MKQIIRDDMTPIKNDNTHSNVKDTDITAKAKSELVDILLKQIELESPYNSHISLGSKNPEITQDDVAANATNDRMYSLVELLIKLHPGTGIDKYTVKNSINNEMIDTVLGKYNDLVKKRSFDGDRELKKKLEPYGIIYNTHNSIWESTNFGKINRKNKYHTVSTFWKRYVALHKFGGSCACGKTTCRKCNIVLDGK